MGDYLGLHVYLSRTNVCFLAKNSALSIYRYFFRTTQRFEKLIYLHLVTDCFMKISTQSSELIHFCN